MELQPFFDATPLLDDPPALRRRADADGYVYLKNLLPRDTVLNLRRVFVGVLADMGWLKAGTDPMQAVAGRTALTENDEAFRPAFEAFQRSPVFHTMSHDPKLMDALEKLFGQDVLAHPRNIGRMMFPDTPVTPPHQDYLHIRGTENTWTAWIPLGDVPDDLGGLAVWAGSHKAGLLATVAMPGAGGSGIEGEKLFGQPHNNPYTAGDVLLLHSLAIHASLPNRTGTRMRLSVDYRYQPMSEPVSPASLKPHFNRFDWDFVYENWPAQYKRYQYYWKDMPLNVVEPAKQKTAGY